MHVRLRQASILYQTVSSFPAPNYDGSTIVCWQSSSLPSGPCNKNKLGRTEWSGTQKITSSFLTDFKRPVCIRV